MYQCLDRRDHIYSLAGLLDLPNCCPQATIDYEIDWKLVYLLVTRGMISVSGWFEACHILTTAADQHTRYDRDSTLASWLPDYGCYMEVGSLEPVLRDVDDQLYEAVVEEDPARLVIDLFYCGTFAQLIERFPGRKLEPHNRYQGKDCLYNFHSWKTKGYLVLRACGEETFNMVGELIFEGSKPTKPETAIFQTITIV